jgi:hypothetical protein
VEIKLQHLIHVVGRNLICRNLIVQNFFFFRKQWIHGQESSPTTMRFMFLYMKQRQQPDEAKQRATHRERKQSIHLGDGADQEGRGKDGRGDFLGLVDLMWRQHEKLDSKKQSLGSLDTSDIFVIRPGSHKAHMQSGFGPCSKHKFRCQFYKGFTSISRGNSTP